jgi:hypothetical protein
VELWALQNRERVRLWQEMSEIRGLMPLLMKQRDGKCWTEVDRRKIRAHLRRLAALSPYMVLFVAPGGFLALPLLAWWLDRRRQKGGESSMPQPAAESSSQHAAVTSKTFREEKQ